jgi:heptosyltransferase-2
MQLASSSSSSPSSFAASASSRKPVKTLVFRLSSLGDVILASSVLGSGAVASGSFGGPVDWVVASEFAPLLRGHPGIRKLWEFDRSSGFEGWKALCRELAAEGYDEVVDLHGSLRTRVARVFFCVFGRPSLAVMRWRTFSKQRWRLYGLYLFKRLWPEAFRPRLFVERFARFAGGTGGERPDLTHLVSGGEAGSAPYYCVMPSSRWPGKCWSAAKYLQVIRETRGAVPVILGGARDEGSLELLELLKKENLPHRSGVGVWSLSEVAQVLHGARAYLGNDTGLAHLSEALGVPALVIYGPTTPEMGFGPWRKQSAVAEWKGLSCRPCGKDGRRCYRPVQKYLCLTGLETAPVSRALSAMMALSKSPRPDPEVGGMR